MTFVEDSSAINRLLNDPNGLVGRDLERRARKVLAASLSETPRETGQLAGSLDAEVGTGPGGLEARIGVARPARTDGDVTNDEVLVFLHEGTVDIPANPFLRRNLSAGR